MLTGYENLDGLSFQEPKGYWANSYIPGDPAMRLLQARLGAWDRGALGQDLRLEQDISPIAQPFDGPRDGAVALYLASDAPAIEGPTRLRVQVGLKGAERQGGHRPAMNIGLVVDQRELFDLEAATRVRALIDALQRARQPGDRFSLTVAGPAGGLLVAPEDFRHGPLSVALERILSGTVAGEALALPVAMELAAESVLAGDDPDSVLGSSLVLLVTGGSLQGDIASLETMAHRNAVGGIPTSVVSLAARDDLSHIDRLVAAGQGQRRVLDSAQAAEGLVDRELHAASRAVARALRLRIRLAPGVELIDVLGSARLGEPQAERVREAEQAIDSRLARTLGIEADRGEDEDGIQIVIPNFYAGDSHVILLDLVADQPGSDRRCHLALQGRGHLGQWRCPGQPEPGRRGARRRPLGIERAQKPGGLGVRPSGPDRRPGARPGRRSPGRPSAYLPARPDPWPARGSTRVAERSRSGCRRNALERLPGAARLAPGGRRGATPQPGRFFASRGLSQAATAAPLARRHRNHI